SSCSRRRGGRWRRGRLGASGPSYGTISGVCRETERGNGSPGTRVRQGEAGARIPRALANRRRRIGIGSESLVGPHAWPRALPRLAPALAALAFGLPLALALAGCAKLLPFRAFFGGTMKVAVSVPPSINQNSPVPVEVLIVYDASLLGQLNGMTAT